jgi:uncharacterized protein YodC (DUF2158 family)
MPRFKQGDAVRTKGGGGPPMTVDGYTPTGDVLCTFWVKQSRKQAHFVEATLEVITPPAVTFGVQADIKDIQW